MFKYRKSMFLALRRCFFLFSVLFFGTLLVNGVITARANTRAMSFDEDVNRVPATIRTQNEIIFPLPNGKINIPQDVIKTLKNGAKYAVYLLPAPIPNAYGVWKAIDDFSQPR